MTELLGVIAALVLVAANGFFVATEFAIARMRLTQVHEFVEQGKPGSKSLREAVVNLDAYLAACQLGITISSIGLGIVGEPVFESLLHPLVGDIGRYSYAVSFGIAFAIITLLHVVFGELAPKSLAIARNTRTALVVAPFMRAFYITTKPFVDFFNFLGNLVLKPFGVPPAREVGHTPHSEDELRSLLRQSLAEGLIDADEREYAENVFSFGDRRARQVMVPRPEIDYVATDDSLEEAAAIAIRTGHTRLPLCDPERGLDEVFGVVNAKDLLRAVFEDRERPLADIARPLRRVSESILVDELLRDLRRDRQHLVLVVDEYGTAIGLVSLEDILEEIVGEITDEFDTEVEDLLEWRDGTLIVNGAAPIHMVATQLGTEITDPHEATIGGHVLELLGRLPEVGEMVELDGHRARVTSVTDARIAELTIEAVEPDELRALRERRESQESSEADAPRGTQDL